MKGPKWFKENPKLEFKIHHKEQSHIAISPASECKLHSVMFSFHSSSKNLWLLENIYSGQLSALAQLPWLLPGFTYQKTQ